MITLFLVRILGAYGIGISMALPYIVIIGVILGIVILLAKIFG